MPLRILCLGAYANGNVGDMYQAEAIARAVQAVRPDAEIVSVSPSKRQSTYPARNHAAAPASGAMDLDFINGFDVLLVGGGGLLSAPHAPLNNAAWVAGLKLPVVALALGAAGDTPAQSADFVRKCQFFSVRDEFSRSMIGDLRADVDIVMDPILLDPADPLPPSPEGRGILWVPGKIVPGTMAAYASLMSRLYDASTDLIVSFNPETDRRSGFEDVFGDDVKYLDTAERFQELAATKRFVVSERYHGCILALNKGIPCVGLALRSPTVTSKITEMYRRLGFAGCISNLAEKTTRQSLRGLANSLDLLAVTSRLVEERAVLWAYLDRVLS
ncbi:polysaccharide pyruvyl transferase family protein [Pararoseomonas indoligenes]|uniref:Polysaccharide pyruvyl transferase family protein n=1 Tax=Roseomonas indoligenes TaxID=2820811 RepID=A0A940S694_9PROT|nr:polysaccharide pyruvyl transferase family protein [Pararoseomonas indoligenes]MBP0495281.1 polysaccharide pyruvyl transferase family protein [Pararoseomonas indoligenes]